MKCLTVMKKNSMKRSLWILLAFWGSFAQAPLLTAEEAVRIALENNFDIRIASNNLKIDQENNTLANAGLLPNVAATVVQDNSIQDTEQVRANGEVLSLDDARNRSLNYGVQLNWTIFDGFRMFARRNELKAMEKLGETELQLQVLSKTREVLTIYYDIVQLQRQLHALDTAMVVSKERVETAYNRYTIGKAAKLEWLNSQVDLNTDATNLLRQKELLANTKARLNEQLAREVSTEFVVSDEVEVNQALQFPELKSLADKQNPQLQAQIINKQIAEYQLKQVRSLRYPQISVNTGYAFNDSYNSLGFNREAHAQGLTYGFSASINIFDGLLQKRSENIAKLNIENAEVAISKQTQSIDTQLLTNFTTFSTNLQLVELERKNEEIARENLEITLAKYRIGTIPTIEIRTAQLNYLNASVRYANALYQAKLSEISLQELTGSIAF